MIAKYREPGIEGKWFLTDFTMGQVEGHISHLEARVENLRTRLAEVEAQRDVAKTALAAIADSRMYGVCARLLGEIRDIAREALAKLEEK